jgi:hypothetical protein
MRRLPVTPERAGDRAPGWAPRWAPGWARRAAGYSVAAGLGGLGALSTLLGAGLSLVGLCCGGAVLAGGAATAGTAGVGTAAAGGPASWPFFAAGAALAVAAWLVHRRTQRRGCRPPTR